METFRNSVQAVTRDTTETNRILAELLQLTVELVGIKTGTLISYAGRLMAAGLSAEEAITAIRGVTERIAEQGKSASVTARVMEQFTQSFNAGIATMQDFRPILREMPPSGVMPPMLWVSKSQTLRASGKQQTRQAETRKHCCWY